MPSRTKKQARFMAAVAHGWKPTQSEAPPLKVAKEFNKADEGTKLLALAMRGVKKKACGGRVYDRKMNAHAYAVGGPVSKTRW